MLLRRTSHGLTADRRESATDWEAEEAESLELCPECLRTGNPWVERLNCLLVFSLFFEDKVFLDMGDRPA